MSALILACGQRRTVLVRSPSGAYIAIAQAVLRTYLRQVGYAALLNDARGRPLGIQALIAAHGRAISPAEHCQLVGADRARRAAQS